MISSLALNPKISIITVVYNNVTMISQCIDSVLKQDYKNVEYIVVDGSSTDGTIEAINVYKNDIDVLISEGDNGLYDAMNKGIKIATGDIIGILNSDDFFCDEYVLSNIAAAFKDGTIDATISDVVFLKKDSHIKIARKYKSSSWTPSKFAWGYMPPHPSFFIKKSVLFKYGLYDTSYKIAADYDLLIRYLLVNKIKWTYVPIVTTKMRLGGLSSNGFKSMLTINKEIYRSCKKNGVFSNHFMIYSKYLFKPFEFFFNG